MSRRILERSDGELQRSVLAELDREGRLKAAEVGVEVDDGIVTLTGVVSSGSKIDIASAAALSASGVTDVVNELTVAETGRTRTDPQIARAVRHALNWNPFLNADEIDCVVRHGVVTLRGTVDRWDQRSWTETTVTSVPGVVSVRNEVEAIEPPSDVVLQREIEGCLTRQLPQGVDVDVSVRGGIVTLRGHIASPALREMAAVLAARMRCVRRVVNELEPGVIR